MSVRSRVNRSSPGSSKPKVSITLVKAIDGYLKFKTAKGLSPQTISSYEFTLNHWLDYIGNREVSEIEASDLTDYMTWLRTKYILRCWNESTEPPAGSPAAVQPMAIRSSWSMFRPRLFTRSSSQVPGI